MQLDVTYESEQELDAVWGPIVIRLLDGAATDLADIERIRELLHRSLTAWPSVGMLLIAHHGSPQPTLAALRRSTVLLGEIEDRLVVGIALLGLGFWAEAGRTTASWLMRMTRGNSIVLEKTVEATVRRMALELVGLDAEGLLAASEELERRFRARG